MPPDNSAPSAPPPSSLTTLIQHPRVQAFWKGFVKFGGFGPDAPNATPPPIGPPPTQLIPCPDCGKQISRQAPTCPGCGRQMIKPPEQKGEGCFLQTMNIGCSVIGFIITILFILFLYWFGS